MLDILASSVNKRMGIYRGKVVDNNDPKKLGRIKLHVPEIHGVDESTGERPESAWAYPRVASAISRIPRINSDVWVQFESGDVERPIWELAPFTLIDGESSADNHIKGKYHEQDNRGGRLTSFPASSGSPKYTSTELWETNAGRIEMEDESIRIMHKSGTRIEILPDGSIELYSNSNVRQVISNLNTNVHGSCVLDIHQPIINTSGTCKITHLGTLESICAKDSTFTYGSLNTNVNGNEIHRVLGGKQEVYGNGTQKVVIGSDLTSVTGDYSLDVVGSIGRNSIQLQSIIGNLLLLQGSIPGLKNQVKLSTTGIDIESMLSVIITGISDILLNAPIVRVGNAAIDGVCKASLFDLFVSHTHPVVGAVAGPSAEAELSALARPVYVSTKLLSE